MMVTMKKKLTPPDAELMRKSNNAGAELSYGVHHVMENRHGLVVAVKTAPAASVTEREAALELLGGLPGAQRKTVGGDKGYDTKAFVQGCRARKITPHVAMNDQRRGGSAIDGRTARHPGYAISQRKRKRIETTFAWAKQYGGLRRMMGRGLDRVSDLVMLTMTGFNLLRMRNIEMQKT